MNQQINDSFLIACKNAYIEGEAPTNTLGQVNTKYPVLISIAKEFFNNKSYDEFAGFFQEYQYFIQLWAAHLLIEYGEPSEELKAKSIEIIKEYSDNPLAPEVAKNERKWLENYFKQ